MKIPDIKGMISLAKDLHEGPQKISAQRRAESRPAADRVELSSHGQQVQQMAAGRTDQSQRSRMVEALRLQFANNELDLDPQATADAMVGEGLFDDLI